MPPKAKPTKGTSGVKTRPGSSKDMKKEDGTKPKSELEKRVLILERECMMLRNNLDIVKIQEELKKSGIQESGLNEIFRESLHNLELKLQKYESSTEPTVSGDLSAVQKELATARDEIIKLKQKQTEMEKLINDKDKNLKAKDEELQAQKENISHSAKSSGEIHALQAENNTLKSKISQLETTIKGHLKNIDTLKNDLTEAQRKQLTVKEVSSQKAKYSKNSAEDHTTKIKKLKKLLEDKHKGYEKLIAELQETKYQMEATTNGLLKNIETLKSDLSETQRKLDETSKMINLKEKEIKEKEEKHYKLMMSKDEMIHKLRKEQPEPTGGRNTTKDNEKAGDKLQKAKEEIEELKNRLTTFVGANIMNADPNISELSDENRPTKLSEKFCELYDNEWTDAYEEVENVFKTEKEAVGYLYNALQDVFVFCKTISEEHARKISTSVLNLPSASYDGRNPALILSNTTPRQLQFLTNEFRKRFAAYLVDNVFQHFVSARRVTVANKKRTEAFLKKCVEICWLMNSQDPPVIFDQSDVQGKYFDGDKYRTYTKSGKVVEFVVWPPMLLHENGPLLCKGVAQGK